MRSSKIAAYEAEFKANGQDNTGRDFVLTPFTEKTASGNAKLNVMKCIPKDGDQSYFYLEESAKEKIVLHFTAGYLKGDIAALTQKDLHVSVSYVIARDGTIYRLWDSKYWSFHLGSGAVGGNKKNSMASVGIEMSNIGPLKKSGNNLQTIYGDTYCTLDEKDEYVQTTDPFRDYSYFAAHTAAQYDSLSKTLTFLTAKHPNIPYSLLPETKRYLTNDEAAAFKGIVSHINFRTSGKWDIGMGFEWAQIEKSASPGLIV